MVIRPPPESDDFSFKLYGCDDRYQGSPHPDSSDGSFSGSCDLNDITPVRNAVWPCATKSKTEEINPCGSSTL